MATFRALIKIPAAEFQRLQEILAIEDLQDVSDADRQRLALKDDETLFTGSATFENGNWAEVLVLTGQGNAWVSYDLMDAENCELAEQEIDFNLAGECEWPQENGDLYVVEVVPEG